MRKTHTHAKDTETQAIDTHMRKTHTYAKDTETQAKDTHAKYGYATWRVRRGA